MKYASIVPLIGGQTLGMREAWSCDPMFLLSFEPFKNNDYHLVQYMNQVPYHLITPELNLSKFPKVEVMSTTCPCAGLSSLSPSANSQSQTNDWMVNTAKLVLETMKPTVLWGENAPRLASKMGEPIVNKLRKIANDNGYTFSLFKTKSKLHGLAQVRDRSFYFFWRGNVVPVFDYFAVPHMRIEDVIRNASVGLSAFDPMSHIIPNGKTPSYHDAFYRYVLEEIEGGITHKQFAAKIERTWNPMDYIESKNIKYTDVAKWLKAVFRTQYAKEIARCERIQSKLDNGMNIMRKTTEIPSGHIGAFVGHMPMMLTHPDVDRYITVRESLEIMAMPKDFQLQGGVRNLNHICQNVPVTTARDMSTQIEKFLGGKLNTVKTDFLVQDNRNQDYTYKAKSISLQDFF